MIDPQALHSSLHAHLLPPPTQMIKEKSYLWTVHSLSSFNELLISWNAKRPLKGHYVILSRVMIQKQWTPWLLYAVWGAEYQYSFHDITLDASVRSFQDQVELLDRHTATGFCIRIEAHNGATLEHFYGLYASTSNLQASLPAWSLPHHSFDSLPVPKISQLRLNHPRSHSFCSPTSTTAVVQYLLAHLQVNPLSFARQVYDAGFDIYGNWAFNVAQAFVELGPQWQCFCVRMPNIEWLWDCLKRGFPVVISVKGTLPGTILPYLNGHLIVIKGYDAMNQQFLCMDPAFHEDEQTEIAYPWQALMQAWGNRRYLSYFFLPSHMPCDFHESILRILK